MLNTLQHISKCAYFYFLIGTKSLLQNYLIISSSSLAFIWPNIHVLSCSGSWNVSDWGLDAYKWLSNVYSLVLRYNYEGNGTRIFVKFWFEIEEEAEEWGAKLPLSERRWAGDADDPRRPFLSLLFVGSVRFCDSTREQAHNPQLFIFAHTATRASSNLWRHVLPTAVLLGGLVRIQPVRVLFWSA